MKFLVVVHTSQFLCAIFFGMVLTALMMHISDEDLIKMTLLELTNVHV